MEKGCNASWAEMLDSSNSFDEAQQHFKLPDIKVEDCDADSSKNAPNREIEIEFNDSENEKKFDKLVTEKKIKSPFKRRLSNEKLIEKNIKTSQADKRSNPENSNEASPTKRFRKDSSESSSTGGSLFVAREQETDLSILDRRQKQIDYGKNTVGYENYVKAVPKHLRTRDQPKTPPKNLKYSRRAWEGLVKSWRKKLHAFDTDADKTEDQD